CGGWGMIVGDEGSGWAIGRGGLAAALRAADGRGPGTALLARFLEALELDGPVAIPPWAGRAEKADVAALARLVVEAAQSGDPVASGVVERGARELGCHAAALARRLEPWRGSEVPVVFHGGVLSIPFYAELVSGALEAWEYQFRVRPGVADAVDGALSYARALVHAASA
ncbi:MAG TPA: BadF/BadG/BcrA/BcrD ATPase family protein, partial [Longimicrobium sp.]|nr:BadF/BadG/BcrA/BcrD ATPase family protein [Longimicrobium sp.]